MKIPHILQINVDGKKESKYLYYTHNIETTKLNIKSHELILFDINLSPLTEGSDWEDDTSGGDWGGFGGGRLSQVGGLLNWRMRIGN